MNRDQKAVAIAEIATNIDESDAIFAVDYRGITVAQVAELVGAEALKDYLSGPTALTFVRGDVATAAKAVADYARTTQLLPFKGGLMDGATLDVEQIRSLSRLPSRDVLYSQLVGVVASPIGGLVRSLSGLIGGLAVALGQVHAKKESGELPAGDAPAAAVAEDAPAEGEAPVEEPAAEDEPLPDEIAKAEETAIEAPPENPTEPEAQDEPAQADDNEADVSAEAQPE